MFTNLVLFDTDGIGRSVQGVLVGLLPLRWSLALLGGPFILSAGKEVQAAGHWGERFEGGFWEDFWLRFAFAAMQVSVLVEFVFWDSF